MPQIVDPLPGDRRPLRADRCLVGLQWGQLDGCSWPPGTPGALRQPGELVSPLPE